ncbi:MAG: DNA polymerase III subunit gamma/tau [Bacteroidales bacterium]|nr:DNA polymerase III subunit gamma/tau [Bacteroidales bacterium]
MENFIVSARKYRPDTFDTVVGQQSITNTLKNAIRNNHLAQSFLFCGPRGVGKTTTARILAKTINCENPTENIEPCNECESCKTFNTSNSFNIHELDAASNNSVDDIRNLVDQVRIPPQTGRYKVYIIDEVHMLSASAFNAFLKTLEEPPAYAKFILATTEKHKIIPTILSRCQIFDFRRIGVEDTAHHLDYVAKQESITAEEDALHIIAQKADGALRDALSIFDQMVSFSGKEITYQSVIDNLNVLDYEYYFNITESLLNNDISASLLTFNDIIEKGFDGQHFLTGLGEHLRNLLVCKDENTVKLLEVGANIKNRYLEQARDCPMGFLARALDLSNKADVNYKSSNNKRLLVEITLMQIALLTANSDGKGSMIKAASATKKDSITTNTSAGKQQSKPVQSPEASQSREKAPEQKGNEASKTQESDKSTPPKSDIPSTGISLKDLTSQSEEKKNEINESKTESYGPVNDFTHEQMLYYWNQFANSLKEDSPNLYFTLTNTKHQPVLKDNYIIELEIPSKNQEDVLRETKGDLLDYLRTHLQNYKIQIRTLLNFKETKKTPYDPKEKYEAMVQRNPKLRKLKDVFNLSYDI